MSDLPLLPTMGVGSYAAPGWFIAVRRHIKDSELGEIDARELVDDATRVVIDDQLDAGIDVLTDGEMGRQRFVFEVLARIANIERVPPKRRLGIPGYDMAPGFVATGKLSAKNGLGTVDEYLRTVAMAPGQPIKIALPGPLTFGQFIDHGERKKSEVMDELVTIVRDELDALQKAGCDYLQLDEPGLPAPPYGLDFKTAAEAINRAFEGIGGRRAVHVCFGNNAGRPMADRRMTPMMPALERLTCDQLLLEFANREMAEAELLADLTKGFDVAAGVIDVKNFYLESAEDVARRLDLCLQYAPAEKLGVTCDCGFSALPRYLARDKMRAMIAGARLVRGRL